MVSPPEKAGLKEARDVDNNIIISDSTLRSILPPQLKKISAQYGLMCGCECCICTKSIILSLLLWWYRYLKNLKYQSNNAKNIRSV